MASGQWPVRVSCDLPVLSLKGTLVYPPAFLALVPSVHMPPASRLVYWRENGSCRWLVVSKAGGELGQGTACNCCYPLVSGNLPLTADRCP